MKNQYRTRAQKLQTTRSSGKSHKLSAAAIAALMYLMPQAHAAAISVSQTPLYLTSTVKPNVMILYDNSQSMDGTMSGLLINGDDPSTRGNIARGALRSVIDTYRTSFNWGLSAFNTTAATKYNTYGYYFGSDGQVVFTNDCVGGVSASNGGLRCVANPQNNNGYTHITYKLSGDDPEINDVLYTPDSDNYYWGIGDNGTSNYYVYKSHKNTTDWLGPSGTTSFTLPVSGSIWSFTPTDAGFLPSTPPNRRMFWVKRGWGYYANITGSGRIYESVEADSTTHYNDLMKYLASETSNTSTTEIKNSAVYTPINGSLKTVRDYFAGTSSPITQTCQKNFVLMATDGRPTGTITGGLYGDAALAVTFDPSAGTWNYGQAYQDVFSRIDALRTTAKGGVNYDIKTFVVGMGSTLNNPESIAALNEYAERGGTVSAFLAGNQADLLTAFSSVAASILAQTSAASAVAVNSGSWNSGSQLYQGRFNSTDWSGQLLSYNISSSGVLASSPSWDAGIKLNAQNWNTGRKVITYNPAGALGSRGVAFRWPADPVAPAATEIGADMVNKLNATSAGAADGNGSQRLEYLRGNTSLELMNCTTCPLTFRNRASSVLGDIINSAPYYVFGPQNRYRDNIELKSYTTYGALRRTHTPMIYVGANDGMLHGFDATTGNEIFAYVPWAVRNNLSGLTEKTYTHKFSVDGSPVVGDVFYDNDWRSILVSPLGIGIKGLFALDVTSAHTVTEATANTLARWEIDGTDPDVGVINSKAAIAKMRDGSYRAIIANGYNSTNGRAVLLLVDIKTGAVTKIDTQVGDSTNKNGLSGIVAVSTTNNNIVDFVYAGDLEGNLWKFDLRAPNPAIWRSAYEDSTTFMPKPLFKTQTGQPITARIDATLTPQGNYMLTFGTGKYLESTDVASTTTQALYGIIDKGDPVTLADLQAQSLGVTQTVGGVSYRLSSHAVGLAADGVTGVADNKISLASYYTTKSGWYLPLSPATGERVVGEASIRFGRASFSTLIPSTAPCSFGGSGWIVEIDALTGNRSLAFDVTQNGAINASDYVSGMPPSGYKINAIPSAATTIATGTDGVDVKFVNTTSGDLVSVVEQGNKRRSQRTGWEQIR